MAGRLDGIPIISEKEKPEKPVFCINYVDKSYDPMEDFSIYSYGKWVKSHPVPEDKYVYDASTELMEWNNFILGKILESCARNSQNPAERALGDFYISIMDVDGIEKNGFKPVSRFMEIIDRIDSKNNIIETFGEFNTMGISGLFSFDSMPDEKNSSVYACYLNQDGLSLPNRDYYFDDSFKEIRAQYINHIKNMFILYGFDDKTSENMGNTVLKIETSLALKSRSPVELRDPDKNYNRFQFNDIEKEFPGLRHREYFSKIGLTGLDYIIIGQPEFFRDLDSIIQQYTLDDWKIYMKWNVLNSAAPFLFRDVEMEHFDFFQRKLLGQQLPAKRWKKAVSIIDSFMGEALGKIYVEKQFGEDSKRRMDDMIEDLKEVFIERINNLSWMGRETKEKALEKFSKFRAKVGYPSKYIDYSSIKISQDRLFENIINCNKFELERETKRIGKPVDKELWEMTPPTVNAYFSPTDNEIVFPAGILQPPFFDPEMDDAVNYGATGATIAHEISHGFDDEGRKYDLNGNLNDWWTPEDDKAFTEKAQSVVDLYNSIEALPGIHVNGALTLGENIADIGGVSIAFEALERRLKKNPELRKVIDGYTPEQRFFMGWAQSWRTNVKDEALKWQILNDVHSPEKIRAEIPAYVNPNFQHTFTGLSNNNLKYREIIIW